MKKEEIFQEIGVILEKEDVDTKTEGWFETRTKAVRNIMDCLTPAEMRELDERVKQILLKGYPPEDKQMYVRLSSSRDAKC